MSDPKKKKPQDKATPPPERELFKEFQTGEVVVQLTKRPLHIPQYSVTIGTKRKRQEDGTEYVAGFVRLPYKVEDGKCVPTDVFTPLIEMLTQARDAYILDIETEESWREPMGKTARERAAAAQRAKDEAPLRKGKKG